MSTLRKFLGSHVDIGQGVEIRREVWTRIERQPKDSLYVKELLVAIWEPSTLLNRSLFGKHSPRFPGRPRKDALTPKKVEVLRDCYMERLKRKGTLPGSELFDLAVKNVNKYIIEKLADNEKMAKREAGSRGELPRDHEDGDGTGLPTHCEDD
ncbi:BEN domain-containing protein 5-like [Haemaphysalis longicornis]